MKHSAVKIYNLNNACNDNTYFSIQNKITILKWADLLNRTKLGEKHLAAKIYNLNTCNADIYTSNVSWSLSRTKLEEKRLAAKIYNLNTCNADIYTSKVSWSLSRTKLEEKHLAAKIYNLNNANTKYTNVQLYDIIDTTYK